MIWGNVNSFGTYTDNFGSTYSNTGLGTSVTAGTANLKGSNVNLLNGIAFDGYFIQICFCGGDASAVSRRYLVDLKMDQGAGAGNAGSSWTTFIANLAANNPNLGAAQGYWYAFPLFIPAGTAIGAAAQCATSSVAIRVAVRIFGKPSNPELLRTGSKVQTLGANTTTTVGATVTPGSTGSMGSYSSSLGTLNQNSFWFQLGILSNDTSMGAGGYKFDVAVDTTSKYLVMDKMAYRVAGTAEQAGKCASGPLPPIFDAPSGAAVFVRGVNTDSTPDSSMSAIVYAVQ